MDNTEYIVVTNKAGSRFKEIGKCKILRTLPKSNRIISDTFKIMADMEDGRLWQLSGEEYDFDTHYYESDVKAVIEFYEKQLTAATDQYNAVVAQNKSLQGELRLYKKMVDILIRHRELSSRTGIKYISFEGAKQQALQELEAENGLY